MAIVSTNDKNYKAIADAIRARSGDNAKYTPEEMPDALEKVYDAGYARGHKDGYGVGHTEGFGYGEESYRHYFWDRYQDEGQRRDYNFAFCGSGWTRDTFWPRYDLDIGDGLQTFAYFGFAGSLKERLAICKVNMVFHPGALLMNLFAYADKITELGVMDFSAVNANENNVYVFAECYALQTIEKLVVPVGQQVWTGWFVGCRALENIRFQGVIVHGGLDLSASPKLTRESMLSLFAALADKNGASGTFRVTLGATNLAKLTSADKAIATGKGWTLS